MKYLKNRNGRYFKLNKGKIRARGKWFTVAPKGTYDIVGFNGKGYFVGIEAKTGIGKLEPEQISYRDSLLLTEFGIYILARSLEDVARIIQ